MQPVDTPALMHLIQQAERSENPRDRANAVTARRELQALYAEIEESYLDGQETILQLEDTNVSQDHPTDEGHS